MIFTTGSLALAACGTRHATSESTSRTDSTGASVSAASGSGICSLLTMSDAQAAFPDVSQATPYTDLEKVGIRACDFASKTDKRVFQLRQSKSSVEQEMITFEAGVMDPTKQAHLKRDPFGAGGEVIVSERGKTPDALGDIGVAALQKGADTIVVSTGTVTGGPDAVKTRLTALVTSAANRVR